VRLGIDFGTTRTVVACCDRGNYPVLSFFDDAGDTVDFFPTVVAEHRGELTFGLDAVHLAQEHGWTLARSFKRLLARPRAADAMVQVGSLEIGVVDLIARFLAALRDAILYRSNRPVAGSDDRLVSVVATPANAHGAQRFVTLDAFRRAGFEVIGMLNEPSAAGFEYTHRHHRTITSKREHIVVYDLGGGTFDASLVHLSGRHHDAVATAGLNHLGGDDFDAVLADVVLSGVKLDRKELPRRAQALLIDQCREAKERLNPSSRRIAIDLEAVLGEDAPEPEVTIAVQDYYEAAAPLVERTIVAMQPVMAKLDENMDEAMTEIAGIYVVGGASALPVVPRVLRDRFGRRVHRSPYPSGAIAIGLAIAADEDAGFEISDRLSRHFGVFREGRGGEDVVFDPIFDREERVPQQGEGRSVIPRVYRAAHNVGRYRFVECAALDARGVPIGDITAYSDVLFPFDPALRREGVDLSHVAVRRMSREGPLIQEKYAVTEHGLVKVTITDLETGYERAFHMGA
jgi:molecular chaperone DnaK (HSP70)